MFGLFWLHWPLEVSKNRISRYQESHVEFICVICGQISVIIFSSVGYMFLHVTLLSLKPFLFCFLETNTLQVFDLLPVCFCLLMRVLCMCLCVKNSSSQQVSDMTVNISDHVDADKLQTFDRLVWDSFHSLTPKTFLQFCTWNSFRFTSAVIWGSYCMHIFVF